MTPHGKTFCFSNFVGSKICLCRRLWQWRLWWRFVLLFMGTFAFAILIFLDCKIARLQDLNFQIMHSTSFSNVRVVAPHCRGWAEVQVLLLFLHIQVDEITFTLIGVNGNVIWAHMIFTFSFSTHTGRWTQCPTAMSTLICEVEVTFVLRVTLAHFELCFYFTL